ncbi:hypothetical protein CAPTEDRAFT_199669 [Capitella teleta]|uniref:Cholesterol side-chain cleavage enzyme, mitochondrial n=1 Tax=Capitella teleta TaxID=283909 RepID=R7U978_CAPTE|nr:hypothetical protein CAPTEDRAFT_199669 [Capitella teleta]|eukprot:ELU02696.1 hypothetical protein CAPTEDRAFT_199669 [Capitella teleta]
MALRRPLRSCVQVQSRGITEARVGAADQWNQGGTRDDQHAVVRTMQELRGPVGWPVVGNFLTYLRKKNRGRMHEVQTLEASSIQVLSTEEIYCVTKQAEQHAQYGRMFREKWGPHWQVHISDPDLIAQVYRQEGKYPNRPSIRSWQLYKEKNDLPMGLTTAEGKTWYKFRSEVSKQLLCPRSMSRMVEPLNNVSNDFIQKLRHTRKSRGVDHLKEQLQNELYKWGMEGAGTLLFETRLGCLDVQISERSELFIAAVTEMLESSLPLIIGETFHQKWNTKFWKRHSDAWDKIFQIGAEYINEKLLAMENSYLRGEKNHSGELLTHLLANKALNLEEIYSNITELLVGAVDTTANSTGFILYLTAAHSHVQEKLHDEVSRVLGDRQEITGTDLQNLPYLKATVKEALRLYPVATMNCRILEADINLNGFRIPRKTLFVLNHYAAGRDPELFSNPDEFIPERWLRGSRSLDHHPFASLPFGFGARSCIGQRMAKLEMHILLAKVIQNFKLNVDESREFKPSLRTLLTPGDCVPVEFTDR